MRQNKSLLATFLACGVLVGLSACGPRGNEPNIELIQDMMEQPSIKAQEFEPAMKNGMSVLVPPSNTQPSVGIIPYKYSTDLNKALAENKNPLVGNMTPEVLLVGQKYFNTNCMICHGQSGKGDGSVAAKYPLPIPALISEKVRGLPDAHIYHIITMGQGTMGPYASHIPPQYRWQVVNYIRHIQQSASSGNQQK